MFNGYLLYGGVEILNQARTFENRKTAECPLGWLRCMPCPTLEDMLGHSYADNIEDSPWYDEEDEPTHRFYGLYPIDVLGVEDSTRTAEIEERISDGAVVHGQRRTSREIRVTGLMIAQGEDALESGMSWLDAALEGDQCSTHDGACGQVDACFLSTCPPERPVVTDYTPWTRGAENLATNPSFEKVSSGAVVVRENLATNPSMEAAGGAVEIRRNLHTSPYNGGSVAGGLANGNLAYTNGTTPPVPTFSVTGGWQRITTPDLPSGGSPRAGIRRSMPFATAIPTGSTVKFTVDGRGVLPTNVRARLYADLVAANGSTIVGHADGYWTGDGTITATTVAPTTGDAAQTSWYVWIEPNPSTGSSAESAYWEFTAGLIEVTSGTPGAPFDGSTQPAIRENLSTNPSLESSLTSWGAVSGASVARDTTIAHQGTASIKVTTPGVSASEGTAHTLPSLAVGAVVSASAWVNAPVGAVIYMALRPNGTTVDEKRTTFTGTGTWQKVTTPAVTNTLASAVASQLYFRTNVVVATTFYVDEVMVEMAPTPGDYFDGATPAVGNTAYAWRGTPGASASYSYDSDLTTAWTGAANASASILTGAVVGGLYGTGGSAWFIRSKGWAQSRLTSGRLIAVNAGGSYADVISWTGAAATAMLGKTYTILATSRATAPIVGGSSGTRRTFNFRTYGSVASFAGTSPVSANVAGVETLRQTFTIPNDPATTTISARLYHGGAAGEVDVWWDDLLIVEGTYTGPYFDGYSDGAIRQNLAQTPNATFGWENRWFGGGGGAGTHTYLTGFGVEGAPDTFVRKTWTAVPNGNGDTGFAVGGLSTVAAGSVVTLSGWLRNGSASVKKGAAGIQFRNAAGAAISGTPQGTQVDIAPGEVVRVSATLTAPAGTVTAALVLDIDAGTIWAVGDYLDGTGALLEVGPSVGDYFDGSTPAEGNIAHAWRGTANATASYSRDSDLTYGWSGTPDASTSRITAALPVTVSTSTSNAAVYSSAHWASTRTRSVAVLPKDPTINNSYGSVQFPSFPAGTYTVIVKIRLDGPQTPPIAAGYKRKIMLQSSAAVVNNVQSESAPDAAGVYEVRAEITTTAPATLIIFLMNGSAVSPVWFDDLAIVQGQYTGGYFDGSTPNEEFQRGQWTGAADASTSVLETRSSFQAPVPDDEYELLTDPLWRRMHGVTCISGPLVTDRYRRGEFYAYGIEFTLLATSPYIYALPKRVDLIPSNPSVFQDNPFNLVPYPSAEIASAGAIVVATNYATNPSVELNTNTWAVSADGTKILAANVAGSLSTELFSVGAASYKSLFTAPSANTAGWFGAQQEVTVPVGASLSFNMWTAGSIQSGTAVLNRIEIVAYWRLAGATVRTDILGTITTGSGAVSVKSVVPPAGATSVIVRAIQYVDSWSTGAQLRLYTDALAVTVP